MEENQVRNNDSFKKLETKIIIVKEVFKEGIQMIQEQILNEEKIREPRFYCPTQANILG
jgi:hypothetical protein